MEKIVIGLATVIVLFASTGCSTPNPRGVRNPNSAESSTEQLFYYADAARKSFLVTVQGFKAGNLSTERVLMVKTLDPQNRRFKEVACIDDGKSVFVSPVYVQVDGFDISAMSDTNDFANPNKLTGTGKLFGSPWDWNHLTFSMTYLTCPMPNTSDKIKDCPVPPAKSMVTDSNFVVKGETADGKAVDQLIGRKQILFGNGTPYELYDLEMDKIPREQARMLFNQMGCPHAQEKIMFGPNW